MKVSFIEPHLEVFGGIRRVIELSNRMVEMGEEVRIYHPQGTQCTWMECKARVLPLKDLLSDEHDVVIFNDPPHYKITGRARARVKVFYILGLYDKERLERFSPKILWPKKGRVMSIKRSLELPFLKITNAAWMQRYLKAKLGVDSLVVGGGINRKYFHPVDVGRGKDAGIRILCTGDPREYKGTGTVVEAVEMLKKKMGNIELDTYYGKGIPQSEMAATYSSADVFADAQWNSGCGWNNPVAEAMACKVPVVCTEIGGVEDFAFHEKTALLVPERDPESLAASIMRLINDEELRCRLREAAYKRIAKFDWQESAAKLRAILKGALSNGPEYKELQEY